MLCVLILYIYGGTYCLKSTPIFWENFSRQVYLLSEFSPEICWEKLAKLRVFEKIFHGRFIYSQNFYQKSAKKKSPKKYFLYFVLMSGHNWWRIMDV